MTTTSNQDRLFEWASSRLDELDAALTFFETKVNLVETNTRSKADAAIADMRKRRDRFKIEVDKMRASGAKAWDATNVELEAEWQAYEDDVETFWKNAGDKTQIYEEAFRAQANAQQKAWRDSATRIKAAAAAFKSDRKRDFDAVVSEAEQIAHDAGTKLNEVHDAGKTSWAALRSALAAFNRV